MNLSKAHDDYQVSQGYIMGFSEPEIPVLFCFLHTIKESKKKWYCKQSYNNPKTWQTYAFSKLTVIIVAKEKDLDVFSFNLVWRQ